MQHSPNRHTYNPYPRTPENEESLAPITHTKYPSPLGKEDQIRYLGKDTNKHNSTFTKNNQSTISPVTIMQNILHYPSSSHLSSSAANTRPFLEANHKQFENKAKPKQPNSSLQPTIMNHTNPIYRKISKLRPNSEDNKYQYNPTQKQHHHARYQSQTKGRSSKYEQQQTTLVDQEDDVKPNNKSPYKTTYNHYHNASSRTQPDSPTQTKRGQFGSGMGDEKFLQKCLQHIMIQNSCLTKQVVVKQMELTRLRQELQKLRGHYNSCKKAKLDIEGIGNMSIIVSANQQDSELDHSQCSISEKYEKDLHVKPQPQKNSSRWVKQDAESEYLTSKQQSENQITFNIENKHQLSQRESQNLVQIHELINQIENEERKLEMVRTNSPSVRQEDTQQSEEGQESSRKKEKEQEHSHSLEGMQLTRLDRLRMKKGVISKRDRK